MIRRKSCRVAIAVHRLNLLMLTGWDTVTVSNDITVLSMLCLNAISPPMNSKQSRHSRVVSGHQSVPFYQPLVDAREPWQLITIYVSIRFNRENFSTAVDLTA